MVIAWNKDTFSLSDMDLFLTIVQYHFARIHVIHRILPRAMDATAGVIVKETVEHILIIEYEFHRTDIFFYLFLFHIRTFFLLLQRYKIKPTSLLFYGSFILYKRYRNV